MRPLLWTAPLALATLLSPAAAIAERCADLAPPIPMTVSGSRPVTARDLIELRDLGNAGDSSLASPISVSPDGRSVAFQIRKADVASNSYCLGMYVVSLDRPGTAVEIDRGGEPIMLPGLWFDAITPKLSGYLQVVEPQWSPDGQWVLYLRRDQGVTQLWRAHANGSGAEKLTHGSIDVADFEWAPSGDAVLFRDRPGYLKVSEEIEQEASRGYHYDDRWQPDDDATKPMIFDRETPEVRRLNLYTGEESIADTHVWRAPSDESATQRADGMIASIVPEDPANLLSISTIQLKRNSSTITTCAAEQCHGHVLGVWWTPGRDKLIFLRQDGWSREDASFYGWRPGAATADLLFRTRGLMTGCKMSAVGLLCMAESALSPRHVVAVDSATGAISTIFEPNPDFAGLRLGSVARLRWKTPHGMEAFGDLVLPPDHKPGTRHPLVVVQYLSRGFLRGGTGDAYPIQLMAASGYAVLSIQDPGSIAALKPARTAIEANRRNVIGAADAREGVSSIETGVATAIATGAIDRSRIAITGLSDGAVKARFAALHSKLFKTALVSSCCDDPTSDAFLGTLNMAERRAHGWPEIGDFTNPHWSYFSLLAKAQDFDTPMLIQASSHEYLQSLVTVMAMQQHHKPVDLYVYPDEFHVQWQPAHRAATYQRDLDWLDFWLEDNVPQDADPARAAEFKRWTAMRAAWLASRAHGDRAARAPKLRRRTAGGGGPSHGVKAASHS